MNDLTLVCLFVCTLHRIKQESVDSDPYCALATFEETFPVLDMKKDMKLDMEPQDMLLNKHSYARKQYVFVFLVVVLTLV